MGYECVKARWFTPGRAGVKIELIVIHSMEAPKSDGRARSTAHFFQVEENESSAHLCCDDKEVIQCVEFEDTAFQCRNANHNGVGIEHAGYAKQTQDEWLDEYGKAMLELSAAAAAALCKQFDIPVQKAEFAAADDPHVTKPGFVAHHDVPLHGSHWDPGTGFPWDYYLGRVQFYFDQQNA